MKPLDRDGADLQRRFSNRRVFLFVDFDGTLAPLVSQPHQARAGGPVMRAIATLAALPRARVAVMSGRPLSFIRARFRAPGLYYGGNHGLEMRGPGVVFRHEVAAALRPTIRALSVQAKKTFSGFAGVLIENKGLSMSIHYRRTPLSLRRRLHRALAVFRLRTSTLPARWRRGKAVWEVLPRVDWDKGRALKELLRRTGPAVPVAVGDDITDEDMFRAVGPHGVGVRVGKSGSSRANYYISRQGDVAKFLSRLVEVLQ
ncbi:MAG: trehalose-phosphatase [Elusimicrobia bacterium]|nr:trehalose-phosphatase [Elusimicrobiota bacterium]